MFFTQDAVFNIIRRSRNRYYIYEAILVDKTK